MDEGGKTEGGLFASLKRLLEYGLGAFQNRIELFAVELQEEKNWVVTALLWTAGMVFFGLLALIFLTVAVVMFCPEDSRPYVLLGFGAAYLVLALWTVAGLRKLIRQKQLPFADSIAELKKDAEWLKSREGRE